MVPCEICGQQYVRTSHKKQHLVCHFKEKLSADLKSTSSSSDFVKNYQIYKCPFNDCQYKSLEKWPTLQHYGIVHNIVDMYLKDYLTTNHPVPPLKSSGQFRSFHGNLIQDHEEQCPICMRVFQTKQGLGNYNLYTPFVPLVLNISIKIIFSI